MLCLLAKTMCGRTQLTIPCADPEEGAGSGQKFYRFIWKYKIGPLPLGKVGPPGNVGPSFSMEYRKVIV